MDELPLYGEEDEEPAAFPLGFREVVDLLAEFLLLGIVVGFLAGTRSPYLKLLLVPMAVPVWVMLRRLFVVLRRIFIA